MQKCSGLLWWCEGGRNGPPRMKLMVFGAKSQFFWQFARGVVSLTECSRRCVQELSQVWISAWELVHPDSVHLKASFFVLCSISPEPLNPEQEQCFWGESQRLVVDSRKQTLRRVRRPCLFHSVKHAQLASWQGVIDCTSTVVTLSPAALDLLLMDSLPKGVCPVHCSCFLRMNNFQVVMTWTVWMWARSLTQGGVLLPEWEILSGAAASGSPSWWVKRA